jgi:hypothetical protein
MTMAGRIRNVYKILIGKPERKRPVGRHRCKWSKVKGKSKVFPVLN